MQITEYPDWYEFVGQNGNIHQLRKDADGANGDHLAKLLAGQFTDPPTTVVIPAPPPYVPTAAERRDQHYRGRLDDHLRRVTLCQVLLQQIPDIPANAAIRTKVASRLAAAKTTIVTVALEIENDNPDPA